MKLNQLLVTVLCLGFVAVGCSSKEEVVDDAAVNSEVGDALGGDQNSVPEPTVEDEAPKMETTATTVPPETFASSAVATKLPEKKQKTVVSAPPKAEKKEVKVAKEEPKGKGQFKTTIVPCPMKAKKSSSAEVLTTVSEGKKLWVESAGGGYYKVFRKKGFGYLAASCFAK